MIHYLIAATGPRLKITYLDSTQEAVTTTYRKGIALIKKAARAAPGSLTAGEPHGHSGQGVCDR